MERTLIATTPTAMEAANKHMAEWAKEKLADVTRELAELHAELTAARKHRWNTKGITRRLKREGKRLDFYRKIRRAVEEGYYVVPNFPGEAFAIRTDAKRPKAQVTHCYLRKSGADFPQPVKMLPEGEGRYVRPGATAEYDGRVQVGKDKEGNPKLAKQWSAWDFAEVEFPVALMKPEAMDATGRAMAFKLFDEMIECRDWARCGDPMVLGRIRNPRQGRPDVTFFVAWVMPLDRI